MSVEVVAGFDTVVDVIGVEAFEMLFGLSGKCEGTGGGQTERIT